MKIPACGINFPPLGAVRDTSSQLWGPPLLYVDFPIIHQHSAQVPGSPHAAVPTEGVVVGNPKCQDQALRPVVLEVGLPEDPMEAWLKHRWRMKSF